MGVKSLDDVDGGDVDEMMAVRDSALVEVGAYPRLVLPTEGRHRDRHPAPARDPQRGERVVRHSLVTRALVGERDPQARDRVAREARDCVEDRADLDPAEAEPGTGPDDPRAHDDHRGIRARDVARHRERRVHRDCLVVAAERVTAGDRRVDELAVAQIRDEVRERDRERGAIGHDVGKPCVRTEVLERDGDRRELAVQRGHDDGHPADRVDVGHLRVEVLLGAANVGLQARVPGLDDVPGALLRPVRAREVPVHDVPASGAEAELHRGGVHDHVVTLRDGPGELGEHVRALRPRPEIDFDPLQPRALLEQPNDATGPERRHRARLPTLWRSPDRSTSYERKERASRDTSTPAAERTPTYRDAMSRSTRSSFDLKGSLQSTVRWAWSFSFRCTQSTV